jgi:hypothetical protein
MPQAGIACASGKALPYWNPLAAGRSAVAAAAYMSCSAILNDYDGIQHDYTRKQGLVWRQVFLPNYAPTEWADRAVLWNASGGFSGRRSGRKESRGGNRRIGILSGEGLYPSFH